MGVQVLHTAGVPYHDTLWLRLSSVCWPTPRGLPSLLGHPWGCLTRVRVRSLWVGGGGREGLSYLPGSQGSSGARIEGRIWRGRKTHPWAVT